MMIITKGSPKVVLGWFYGELKVFFGVLQGKRGVFMVKRSKEEHEIVGEERDIDPIGTLREMFGLGRQGFTLTIYRLKPNFMVGPVQTLDWDEEQELTWEEIDAAYGGGRYKIGLKGIDGKYKRTTTFTIAGFPKYKGKTVTCEADMAKVIKQFEDPIEPVLPPQQSKENFSDKLLMMVLDNQNKQTQMIMDTMKEIRKDMTGRPVENSNPYSGVENAMGMATGMIGLAKDIQGLSGDQQPSNNDDDDGSLDGGIEEKVITTILSLVTDIIKKPKKPKVPPPPGLSGTVNSPPNLKEEYFPDYEEDMDELEELQEPDPDGEDLGVDESSDIGEIQDNDNSKGVDG